MSRLVLLLTPAHLVLSAAILVWDVVMAGRIVQLRRVPSFVAGTTALAGLLIAPALFVAIATSSLLYGRAVSGIAWVWAATLVLFAGQALGATARGLVSPFFGVPIAVYDLLLAGVAAVRYAIVAGATVPSWALLLPAAQASALGLIMGPAALWAPSAIQLPILAPTFPARWTLSYAVRGALALVAAAAATVLLLEIPRAAQAVESYGRYASARLQERPKGDLTVGIRILPELDGLPPAFALRNDLALLDSLGTGAVALLLDPEAARGSALDSIARSLDQVRHDSVRLVVALGYPRDVPRTAAARDAYTRARLADVQRISRRLRPDYLIPASDPYDAGSRALGLLPVEYWRDYFEAASAAAHRVDRRIRVGFSASRYDSRDSALYAWAAAADSPMDAVGFNLRPSFRGARTLEARTAAADRWMRATPSPKEHWVFGLEGFPLAHGEESQRRAILGVLAWATERPTIRGVLVGTAGDYDELTGLRAATGRIRPAGVAVARAIRALRESIAE